MERKTPAIIIILASLVLGLIGYIFFNGRDLGLSVPIFTAIFLGVMLGFARHSGMEMNPRRLWLIVPILFFASMFFIRANETLLIADAIAIIILFALMSNHLNGKYLDEVGWLDYIGAVFMAAIMALVGGFGELGATTSWLRNRPKNDQPNKFASVLRGLFIALPILLIFAVLLGSADPIFQDRMLSVFDWFDGDFDISTIIQFFFVTLLIAWLSLGAIVFAITPSPIRHDSATEEENIDKKTPRFLSLNMTETGIILGGVVLLFAFFVFIQFTYLFGQQEIFLENMTFADYARRGFFELVAVSLMTLGLMLILDRITLKRAQSHQMIFRISSVLLVGLTLVMLASAWRRMALYEEAYGFSHLRLYTHVFMVWLGILLLVGLLDIFRVRAHIFTLGALLVAMGYLGTLNLMTVDAYIAQHNIDRYRAGEDLDVCYFYELSADAVPVIDEFYQSIEDAEEKALIEAWLITMRIYTHRRMLNTNFLEANLSYLTAEDLLADVPIVQSETYNRWSCYIYREN